MSVRTLRTFAYRALIAVSLFHALSAVGGGIGMVVADGLSMPKSLLADSPFSTFLIPGVILTVVVGGTQCVAVVLLLAKRLTALLWSAVAGFGMLIWIIAEIAMIHALTWAQLIYVVSGFLQLILVFSLLGIVSWLPRDGGSVPRALAPAVPDLPVACRTARARRQDDLGDRAQPKSNTSGKARTTAQAQTAYTIK